MIRTYDYLLVQVYKDEKGNAIEQVVVHRDSVQAANTDQAANIVRVRHASGTEPAITEDNLNSLKVFVSDPLANAQER